MPLSLNVNGSGFLVSGPWHAQVLSSASRLHVCCSVDGGAGYRPSLTCPVLYRDATRGFSASGVWSL